MATSRVLTVIAMVLVIAAMVDALILGTVPWVIPVAIILGASSVAALSVIRMRTRSARH